MRTFLFGMLLGALAGVLYAPATGNRTRSLLRDKMTKAKNDTSSFIDSKGRDLSNRLEGARYKANKAITEIKEQAREKADQMQGVMDSTMIQAQDKVNQAKERAQEKMNQVRDSVQEAMKDAQDRMPDSDEGTNRRSA